MENIILLTGKVKYKLTLDPGVWIFDDRRIDLTAYSFKKQDVTDTLEAYTKAASAHWDREIAEGAIFPPTLKSEKKYEKEKVLTGTFAVPFKPFITNAEPEQDAEVLIIETSNGEVELPLPTAYDLIFKFSDNGKPLREDGPIHIIYGDGSNIDNPIKNIKAFIIK
jgi:hypothetical protein